MRNHPRMSVNELSSWRQTFDEDVEMWRALDVDHVGLVMSKVDVAGRSQALTTLAREGMRVSTIAGPLPVLGGTTPSTDQRRVDEGSLLAAVELAAELGVRSVYTGTGNAEGRAWDEAVRVFADAVEPARARAEMLGITIAIEPTNPLRCDRSFVFTLRDAIDVARSTGVTVCADLQSCWNERAVRDTFAANAGFISLVQVSDFVIGTFDSPNRAVPGDGDMPVRDLLAMALDAGYSGPFDLEVLGPRIEAEGYASAIGRSVDIVSQMLDDLGA